MPLFPKIISNLETKDPSPERKKALSALIYWIKEKKNNKETIRLNFICTHNSRRSHLAQVWAQALAYHYGLIGIECYSGGTSETALFPKIAETLEFSGFEIRPLSKGENPIISIKYAENELPIIGFSKVFDSHFNPKSFAAILVCDQADQECPVILGAEARFSLPFWDPKTFDDTALQTEKYLESSLQIANEMAFVFSSIGD